ncbi:MAG: TRAP transporter small permease [Propionibacteriaceae bacterium]
MAPGRGPRSTDQDDLLAKVAETAPPELESTTPPSRFRVVRVIDRTVEMLAALTLATITLIMFANATGRYLLNSPLGWAEEIVTGLLLWLVVFGLFVGIRRRELIIIRVLVGRFKLKAQVRFKVMADLLSALVLGHLAWFGLQYLLTFGGDASAYLRIPKGFFTAALPIGTAAAAIALILQLRSSRETVTDWIETDRAAGDTDAYLPAATSNAPIKGERS